MNTQLFGDISNQLADVVERGAGSVVQVRSGRWRASAGTVCVAEHVLVADHALRHEEDVLVRADGQALSAGFVGRDPSTDLALLKVPGLDARPALRAAGQARVGQLAVAVGRGWSGAVVAGLGIVSSVGGPWRTGRGPAVERVIRTDATPYPGFAGGALIDADGSVLGIATGILLRGLGLVIPASIAWPVAEMLVRHGRIRRAFLGVSGQPVRLPAAQPSGETVRAVLVVGVSADSPASRAGLLVGDLVLSLNGHRVEEPEELLSLLHGDLIGRPVSIDILRGGTRQTIEVSLTERPSERQ